MPCSSTWKTPQESVILGTISSSYLDLPELNKIHQLTIFSSPIPFSSSFLIKNHQYTKQRLREKPLLSGKIRHGDCLSIVQCKDKVNREEIARIAPDESSKGGSNMVVKKVDAKTKRVWKKKLFGSRKLRSVVLLNLVTLVYASNILVVKEAETYMDPAEFSAVRFVLCAIPFLPFVFEARNDVQIRKAGLELGLWMSLGQLMEAFGLLTAEAGRASFISLFTVIVVPLFENMLGTLVPVHTWFGILMSVLGMAMLECSGSPPNVGDLLNFLSAVFFGLHTLRTEHITRKTKKGNFLALLGYEVCVIAIISTIWYLIGGTCETIQGGSSEPWTWPLVWDYMVAFPWIPALYTGVLSTGFCLWAEIEAMRYVSATEAAVIYGMEPIWGAGFAWFILGERWELPGWIGAALVLGGSLTVQMYDFYHQESRKTQKKNDAPKLFVVSQLQKQRKSLTTAPVVASPKDVIDKLNK